MDKVSLAVGVVVFSVILSVYYSKVPVTEAYINGAGKMPVITEQQYSAEYLYKNSPSVAPNAANVSGAATDSTANKSTGK